MCCKATNLVSTAQISGSENVMADKNSLTVRRMETYRECVQTDGHCTLVNQILIYLHLE